MSHRPGDRQRFQLQHTAGVAVPDAAVLEDMRRVASEFGGGLLSSRLYQSHGQYSHTTARRRFGSWNNALQAAGLSLRNELDI